MEMMASCSPKEKGCGEEYILEGDDSGEIKLICGHQGQGLCHKCSHNSEEKKE